MNINTFLRNTIFAGLFLLPFIPFLVTQSTLFPFITGKNIAFRIIVEIIFAVWVILALRDHSYRPRLSGIFIALTSLTFFAGISAFLAVDPYKAFWSNFERMEGYITILHLYALFIALSSTVHIKKWWNYLLSTWFVSALLMCLFALFQLGGKATINQGGVRVDGTMGNATYLAVFLLCTIFFGVLLFVRKNSSERKKNIFIFLPTILLQLVILYYTATRGAILGLLGGALITLLLVAFFEKEEKALRKTAIGLLCGLALLIGGFFVIRDADFVTKSPVLSRFASLSASEIKTQGRYFIWPMAIQGFKEKPLFGWGQEGFNYVFNKNYDPRMYAQEQWFDRAHSVPLDWLVATGLFGFLSYLALLFFSYWYIWKSKDGDFSLAEKSVLTGLLSAYIFQGIFVFDNLVSYILFFTFVAMLHSLSGGRKIHISERLVNHRVQGAITGVLIIIFCVVFYFGNWKPLRAGQTVIEGLRAVGNGQITLETLDLFDKVFAYNTFASGETAEQLATIPGSFLKEGVSTEIQERYVAITRRELDKRIADAPENARYYLFRGIFYRSVGDGVRALEDLEKALSLSPRKQSILFEMGSTLMQVGKEEEALAVFRTAFELEPSFSEARKIYGIVALSLGQEEEARRVLGEVSEQEINFDDRIVNILAQLNRWGEIAKIFSYRIENGDDSVDNNVSLAVAYLRSGSPQKSIITLERIALKNPNLKSQMDYFINEIRAGRDPSKSQ